MPVHFTWDTTKAATNLRKHGVSFEEATTVFSDPLAIVVEDAIYIERAILIGQSSKERLLFTVFLELDADLIRIVSARRATSHEGNDMKKANHGRAKEPSRKSLREMPEVDFKRAKIRRNPYAERIASEGISIHSARGRPKKGTETGPTIPRSVRFPASVWEHLEQCAKAEGIPLHAALRAAVMAWVNHHREVHHL